MHETGAVRKDPGGRLNVALVYPNTYHVGMSNLGVHAMYSAFNNHPGIACERFFLDYPQSVESGRALSSFHIIAFSVSYELDWINVIRILKSSQIPLRSSLRSGLPLVIAGGAAVTLNPEPAADAMDICFLGDGENAASPFYEAFVLSAGRKDFLKNLEGIPGIYIPGNDMAKPVINTTNPIDNPSHTAVITSHTSFKNMFAIETARGCPFSCRFCAARHIYSPFRPAKLDSIIPVLEKARQTGLKIGLISASLNNHPEAAKLYETIECMGLKIAPPSLRHGRITPELIRLLNISGVKGVTLAPETGSDKLRALTGKNISNEVILKDIELLVAAGVLDIKLYFLTGLPGETPDDIESIIDIVTCARQIFLKISKGNRRIGNIHVSINTFTPKPHTDYERSEMISIKEAKKRIKRIESRLKSHSNMKVSHESLKSSYLQAVISRGDRDVLDLMENLAERPETAWQDLLKAWHKNPDDYALRRRDDDETLPWDFYKQ